MTELELEWREKRSSRRVHAFRIGSLVPICGKHILGACTYPIDDLEVEDRRICKQCLRHRGW